VDRARADRHTRRNTPGPCVSTSARTRSLGGRRSSVGGIAITKFLFFVLIVAALLALIGFFTRTA
jgi:hypothetical protein